MTGKKRSETYLAIAFAVVLAVAFSVSRAVAVEAVYPVEHAKRAFAVRVWTRVKGFFRGAEARAENVRLRREAASLAMLKGDIERLETENARLRLALGYVKAGGAKWLAAGVLSTQGGAAGAGDVIRVDKGSLAGVREGAVVSVPEGLVGRVRRVTPHTAEVSLITDERVKVGCEVENFGEGRVRGILCGGSDEALVLRYLPSDLPSVFPRAKVVTSGLGGAFPKGIEVGAWIAVQTNAQGRVLMARVEPAVDFTTLEDVFIRREK